MPRPTEFPRWATGEGATVEEPSEEAKDLGHVAHTVLTARLANWLQKTVYDWLVYLDEEVASGGGGGAASGLDTTGAAVDVSAAAPPVVGQVLMATDAEHAVWKVPGLHYDPSIRFWVDSTGEATIEPGTWGFVYTTPVGSTGVTVFVVSSLTAPPVDSRFGLYVSPSVTVPVTVSLIGASQIMGLDGVLASTVELRPGAMYEWVFYHEDSAAIWGLVSDTAHVAKAIATTGDAVTVNDSDPPLYGDVLAADSPTAATWRPHGLVFGAITPGQWGILPDGSEGAYEVDLSEVTLRDGIRFGALRDTTTPHNEIELSDGGDIQSLDGTFGSIAPIGEGQYLEWVYVEAGEYGGVVAPRWYLARNSAVFNASLPLGAVISDAGTADRGDAFGYARVDHQHEALTGTPAALAVGGAAAAGTSQLLSRNDHAHEMPGLATTSVDGFLAAADKVKIDAALEQAAIDALMFKAPVRVVSNANIALTGLQVIGSVTLVAGDRVLCISQTTTSQNGIHVASASAWSRATDADSSAKMASGHLVACTEGTFADTVWMLTTNNPITLGVTGLSYATVAAQASGTAPPDVKPSQAGSASLSSVWRYAREDHAHRMVAPHNGLNGIRISTTTTSGIATDGTFTNVTLVPFTGNRTSVYDGSVWVPMTVGASNLSLSGQTAGVPMDIFIVYVNATTVSVNFTAWTNATTRATALTLLDGVWVKATNSGHRYIGTILPDSATTFTHRAAGSGSTKAVCGIWNVDNQIRQPFEWQPTFDTWSPSAATTWEIYGGGSGPHIEAVVGLPAGLLSARALAAVNAGAAEASLAVSYDGSLTPAGVRGLAAVSGIVPISASASHRPASGTVGVKTVNAIAHGTTTAPVFYGAHGGGQAGLTLDMWH